MRIVVKVGTSTLAHTGGRLNIRRTEQLVKVLSDLKNSGHELILVSSGAIGLGAGKLQIPRPKDMPTKQAAAAVGQCELMYVYDRLFADYNHTVAQLLLTREDFDNETRLENLENTVFRLLELGVIPIINENDTVATEEISVGDNDTLSALVAVNVGADLLVILSDVDGLYTADPHSNPQAKRIERVEKITPEILALGGGKGSALGTGGMKTKLRAATLCVEQGCDMIIADGQDPDVLYAIVAGESVGTRFVARGQVCN
jgi:glutamate 5-kinase